MRCIRFSLAVIRVVSAQGTGRATTQFAITVVVSAAGESLATLPNTLRRKQQ